MTWIPVILIWAALITVGAYYIREWWRVGRDPKGTTIIPRFARARRAVADGAVLHLSACDGGGRGDQRRSAGLARRTDPAEAGPDRGGTAGPQIVAQEGGDGEGLQDDLVKFLDRLIPRGRAATTEDFRKAAYQHWIDIHAHAGQADHQLQPRDHAERRA